MIFHIFAARWRFTPEERGCYFEGEISMKYLPSPEVDGMYRYEQFRFSTTNLYFKMEEHTFIYMNNNSFLQIQPTKLFIRCYI